METSERAPEEFSERFSSALAERGITLKQLHARLLEAGESVSMATLSYWRSGGRRPEAERSVAVVESIERALELPAGDLRDRIAPVPRLGSTATPAPIFSSDRFEQLVVETNELLGVPDPERHRVLSVHAIYTVRADRAFVGAEYREVHQALREGATGFAHVHIVHGHNTSPEVTHMFGVRLAKHVTHPSGEAFGYLFEYTEPVPVGSTTLVEYALEAPLKRKLAGFGTEVPLRELVLQVRFEPGAVPQWIEAYSGDPLAPTAVPLRSPDPSSAMISRTAFGPGSIGIRWDYDD